MNIIRRFGWLGVICFFIYSVSVILGWILIPNYDDFNQAISDLLIGSYYKTTINITFLAYNLSLFLYGTAIFVTNRNSGLVINTMAAGLIMSAFTGILMFFFPEDQWGAAKSLHGSIHLFLAGLMALLALFSTFEGYFAFRSSSRMKRVSLVLSVGIFVFAVLTLIFDLKEIRTGFGMLERVTVFFYVSWVMLTGIYFLKTMNGKGMAVSREEGKAGNQEGAL